MSSHKLKAIVDKWAACRKETISSLRSCAKELESSHRRNAKEEHGSAKMSLTGSLAGLGGFVLAPMSGGLSLGLFGLSSLAGFGSYFKRRQANQEDESVTNEVKAKFKSALDKDDEATAKVMELLGSFEYLEEQAEKYKIHSIILVSVQKTSNTNLNISKGNINSKTLESDLISWNTCMDGLRIATQGANLFSILTTGKEVTKSEMKFSHVDIKTDSVVKTKFSMVSDITKSTLAVPYRNVALGLNAVLIPLDIYNLVVTSENLGKSHGDVKQIEDTANKLETEMENMRKAITVKIKTFTQLHVQLCEMYKEHHNEVIYEYLKTMYEKLEFHLPCRY